MCVYTFVFIVVYSVCILLVSWSWCDATTACIVVFVLKLHNFAGSCKFNYANFTEILVLKDDAGIDSGHRRSQWVLHAFRVQRSVHDGTVYHCLHEA